jgi:hypothetical protein
MPEADPLPLSGSRKADLRGISLIGHEQPYSNVAGSCRSTALSTVTRRLRLAHVTTRFLAQHQAFSAAGADLHRVLLTRGLANLRGLPSRGA